MLKQIHIIFYLKLAAVVVFVGRGYQYLFFGAPFRSLLWDESLLQPIVDTFFNSSWNEYATSIKVDKWISFSIMINGIVLFLGALASVFIKESNRKFLKFPILLGGISLGFLAFLTMKENSYQVAQFFELSIQIGVPFLLLYVTRPNMSFQFFMIVLKLLVSLTFIAHGLYAIGYYEIPGHFIDMTINSFGITENRAVLIMKIAGTLDFLVAILIFIPKVSKYALIYAVIWGTLTALARFVAAYNPQFIAASFHQTVYLVCYRLSHGIIPLLILVIQKKQAQKERRNLKLNFL
ncbi:hypothetical protein Q4Q35_00500 [Flavivirga aquimarina]|uniref:Uncharacterized protein n=1 Tax=Flavivirga aquimarina TaxID=2027862 RepID=A0ABT8W5D3_9FLAO|nr:hypothetical protein [Flavivirga aquimarina]MDO5968274.1 hypothetical protein [Flavivirga aquimarina]